MILQKTRRVSRKTILERLDHHERLELAGVDRPEMDLGKPVVLWRRFRDGKETREVLPAMIADWTLATIPEREPHVARARIYRIPVIEMKSDGDVQ